MENIRSCGRRSGGFHVSTRPTRPLAELAPIPPLAGTYTINTWGRRQRHPGRWNNWNKQHTTSNKKPPPCRGLCGSCSGCSGVSADQSGTSTKNDSADQSDSTLCAGGSRTVQSRCSLWKNEITPRARNTRPVDRCCPDRRTPDV